MAIDTREKRASVPGVGRPWMRGKNPNASKTQAWRLATGLAYAGNALSAGALAITTLVRMVSNIVIIGGDDMR